MCKRMHLAAFGVVDDLGVRLGFVHRIDLAVLESHIVILFICHLGSSCIASTAKLMQAILLVCSLKFF